MIQAGWKEELEHDSNRMQGGIGAGWKQDGKHELAQRLQEAIELRTDKQEKKTYMKSKKATILNGIGKIIKIET